MDSYSPPEYQRRATQREQRTRKRAELTRFILWMYQDVKAQEVPAINEINTLVDDFLAFDFPVDTDGK